MYKLSKYTYCFENDNKELLLYNSSFGTRSMCKIVDSKIIEQLQNDKLSELDESIQDKLLERKIIVPKEDDEAGKINEIFINTVADTNLTLIINPTEKCNFRCKYCYESFANGRMSEEMQKAVVKYVEKNLHKYTGLNVMWFGGEPLLQLDVITNLSEKFIKICKTFKKRYTSQITSNGYLLNGETFEKLLELHVNRFQITIDGTRDIHNSQRVTAGQDKTFDTIIDNLKYIKENIKRRDFYIVLRTNVTKDIFERMDEYLEWAEYFCKNDKRFAIDIEPVGNWLEKAEDTIVEKILIDNQHRKVFEYIYEHAHNINLVHGYLEPGGDFCPSGRKNTFLIGPTGKINKCTLLFETDESRLGTLELNGTIQFNEMQRQKWLAKLNACEDLDNCQYAPICLGSSCMSARNNLESEKDIQLCSFRKHNMDITLKILDKVNHFEVLEGEI